MSPAPLIEYVLHRVHLHGNAVCARERAVDLRETASCYRLFCKQVLDLKMWAEARHVFKNHLDSTDTAAFHISAILEWPPSMQESL